MKEKSIKWLAIVVLLLISVAGNELFATNYMVSGAGSSEVNGTYVENGTWNEKPLYIFNNAGTEYAIGHQWGHWTIGQWIVGEGLWDDYSIMSEADTPPSTGWGPGEMGMGLLPYPTVDLAGYAVTYNANEATGGAVPAPQEKEHGISLTLATNSGNLVRSGYLFDGWNTLANGSGTDYAEGAQYTANETVTLYAKWSPNLVMNGDFTLGNTGFTTSYIHTPGAAAYTNDLDAGRYVITTNASLVHQAWTSTLDHTNDTERLYFVANGHTSTEEIVWQTATPISVTEANTVYRFEAYVTSVFGANPPQFRFELGDGTTWAELGNTVNLTDVNPGIWTLSYADGKFSQPGNYYVRLRNLITEAYGNDFGVDDIYFGFRSNAPSENDNPGLPEEDVEDFSTPVVVTIAISAITQNTAQSGGDVTSEGTGSVTARGIVWGTSSNPDLTDNVLTNAEGGIGSYTSELTGLSPSTEYFVRAYATNSGGTVYGENVSFITSQLSSPTNVALQSDGSVVEITWNPVQGATGYAVYSSADPYGTFMPDDTGAFDGEKWTAPLNGNKMFYYVKASAQ